MRLNVFVSFLASCLFLKISHWRTAPVAPSQSIWYRERMMNWTERKIPVAWSGLSAIFDRDTFGVLQGSSVICTTVCTEAFSMPLYNRIFLMHVLFAIQTLILRLGHVLFDRCMTFADCRLQIADCRPQIADCKLKDTKNLPSKGDTIKNITSCESEKVAWEQGWCFCAKLHWPHFQDAVSYSSPTRLFIDSPGLSLIALILYSSLIIVNW